MSEARTRTLRSLLLASRVITLFLLVAALRIGQSFFIPIALSLLLSFLLAPAVGGLERRGLPRYPTAVMAVLSTLLALLVMGWLVVDETSSLLSSTPQFKQNLSRKYTGAVDTFQDTVSRVEKAFSLPDRGRARHVGPPAASSPLAVAEAAKVISPVTVLSYLGLAIAELIILTLVVAVLSVFLLVHREEAQDRILGLAGESRLIVATQFMNDIVYGVRRYLLLNLVVNILYGTAFGLFLFLLGVPSPLLWASIAVVFRFIPHIGVYLSLIPPVICALSLSAGWFEPLVLIAAGVSIDVIISNFVEPHVYGRGIGVSSIAIVISALFWTWCWGVVGLLLATPFTVCLAVLGRYVPGFESFSILFGKETGLRPAYRLYHRLVAGEITGARRLIQSYENDSPEADIMDELIVPALMFVEADFQQRILSAPNYRAVLESVRSIAPRDPSKRAENASTIAVYAVRLESEGVIAEMLVNRLEERGHSAQLISEKTLSNEAINLFREAEPAALILVAHSHLSAAGLRYLLKRLQPAKLDVPIVVLALGPEPHVAKVVRNNPLPSSVLLVSSLAKVDEALAALALSTSAERNAA